jgi:hypothetical protein
MERIAFYDFFHDEICSAAFQGAGETVRIGDPANDNDLCFRPISTECGLGRNGQSRSRSAAREAEGKREGSNKQNPESAH